jgi:antitoxin component YwqK of YwqJK toxin-antitoxin module
LWIQWHPNGKKANEGEYYGDKKGGIWTTWHDHGQKESSIQYRNGEEYGLWTRWYPNGQKQAEGEFHGQRIVQPRGIRVPRDVGDYTAWYENGRKALEGNYQKGDQGGLKDGNWTYWDESGNRQRVELWQSGKLVKTIPYKNGEPALP